MCVKSPLKSLLLQIAGVKNHHYTFQDLDEKFNAMFTPKRYM